MLLSIAFHKLSYWKNTFCSGYTQLVCLRSLIDCIGSIRSFTLSCWTGVYYFAALWTDQNMTFTWNIEVTLQWVILQTTFSFSLSRITQPYVVEGKQEGAISCVSHHCDADLHYTATQRSQSVITALFYWAFAHTLKCSSSPFSHKKLVLFFHYKAT